MPEPTVADLKPDAAWYRSSRPLWDVLVGKDTALPLINALSNDPSALPDLLSQPEFDNIALEKPHCIFGEYRSKKDDGAERKVYAMPQLNVKRLVTKAALGHNVAAISTLIAFASRHDIAASSLLTRDIVDMAVKDGNAAMVEALVAAEPGVLSMDLDHGKQPLDVAIPRGKIEVVEVLLRHGADASPAARGTPSSRAASYECSLLSFSTRFPTPRLTELLLQHGIPVAGSGALHHAADHARQYETLDTMRLLIEHGSDVDERLPRDSLPRSLKPELRATWTPMHFAAAKGKPPSITLSQQLCRRLLMLDDCAIGQIEAMELLQSFGARTDIKDGNGRTAMELFEERKRHTNPGPYFTG